MITFNTLVLNKLHILSTSANQILVGRHVTGLRNKESYDYGTKCLKFDIVFNTPSDLWFLINMHNDKMTL